MKIGYLINQYPKVSHSFIRREIVGVEGCGLEVARFSIRSCSAELVDEIDKLELEKTEVILEKGSLGLLSALLRVAITQPLNLLSTLRLMFQVARYSDRGILRHLAYLAEACVLLHRCSDLGIAHIHAHFGTNSTTVAMFCRSLGGPTYSFTVHGPEEFDQVKALALEEKINRSAFVVAVSSFGRSQLYRWCDRSQWPKIHIIHCGVDNLFLAQSPPPLSNPARFVCVGRLSEQKGHLLLVEAVAQLAAQGLKFQLILVGDGPLRNQIESLITQFHLHDYIKITGWASSFEVQQQLLNSGIMVLPSFAEGLPVVIMEALALERPIISTYVAGIPELVEPGICGWLIPPGSVAALTTAMQTALQSPVEKLVQMGKIGAERVAQQHDATLEASKLADLFESHSKEFQPSTVEIPSRVH